MPLSRVRPAELGERDIGDDADADDRHVGRDALAGSGFHGDHPAGVADDAADRGVEADVGTPAAVEGKKVIRDLRRHDPAHQAARGFEHGNGLAEQASGRGDLEADEAAADNHHITCRVEPFADLPRVLGDPEREDAVEADPLDRRQPRPRAGGERQPVEGETGTVGKTKRAGPAVDRRRLGGKQQADVVLLVEGGRTERQQVVIRLLEEGLGERRPLIRDVRLGSDQRQRPVIAFRPEACRHLRSAVPAADDDDAFLEQLPVRPVCSPCQFRRSLGGGAPC